MQCKLPTHHIDPERSAARASHFWGGTVRGRFHGKNVRPFPRTKNGRRICVQPPRKVYHFYSLLDMCPICGFYIRVMEIEGIFGHILMISQGADPTQMLQRFAKERVLCFDGGVSNADMLYTHRQPTHR